LRLDEHRYPPAVHDQVVGVDEAGLVARQDQGGVRDVVAEPRAACRRGPGQVALELRLLARIILRVQVAGGG